MSDNAPVRERLGERLAGKEGPRMAGQSNAERAARGEPERERPKATSICGAMVG